MKLRQRISFGLCAFYLISIIGVALSLHFCGGKLSSVHFTETKGCSACGKMDSKTVPSGKCCKNTNVNAKVTDSHEPGFKVNLPQDFSIRLFLAPVVSDLMQVLLPKLLSKTENKAPPLSARLSLYAYHCVFRN